MMTNKNRIYVVGITSEDLHELAQLPADVLEKSVLFIGAEKHRKKLKAYKKKLIAVTPLKETLQEIEETLKLGNIIVLASGDPLFYGIGSTLLKSFDRESLVFYPALTSIQRACSLFKISWHDARIFSLHGRKHPHLAGLFLSENKCLTLTDSVNTPAQIAGDIARYLQLIDAEEMAEKLHIMVAENIGSTEENLFSGSLEETVKRDSFSSLNVFFLINENITLRDNLFGLSEKDIQHSRGLITKSEIRACSLHKLSLPEKGVLWDIGGGSGSVSIEAAKLAPQLIIYCLEKKEEEIANIKENIRRFGCYNIIPVHGNAVDKIPHLPAPDRVFVGGSGGKLEEIITISAEKLPAAGRLVVNSVLEKTASQAPIFMKAAKLTVSSSTISVLRNKGCEDEQQLNPITVTSGIKDEQ